MINLSWVKCTGEGWCPLLTVNLEKVTAEGVYIIWHGGNPSHIVRVGQGIIAERLADHRDDPAILAHKNKGTLYVTWAADLPPVIRPPVLLVRMLQEPVADSPRRCGAGRDYRSAASVQ